ncbi:MAG: hypothetical protein WCH86_02605 [Kiritimatiellales bacterium]
MLDMILYGIVLYAVLLLLSRILRQQDLPPELRLAAVPVLFALILYGLVILPGTFGIFSRLSLSGEALLLILFCHRETIGAGHHVKAFAAGLDAGFRPFPALLWFLFVPLVIQIMSPVPGGDSLVYHLPNISYFLKSGSTATFLPELLYRPEAITAYYARGMEALYAFFYQFPASRFSIVIFKWLLFLSFYFILNHTCSSRPVAAALTAFCASLPLIHEDLGSLKNDLPLALLLVFASALLTQREKPSGGLLLPAAAMALALAIKSSALFYVAPLFLMWVIKERRRLPAVLIYTSALIVPLGLYFYFVNLLANGSPLFPFGVSMFGITFFPGAPNRLTATTLLSNLDHSLPFYFLRGLLRQAGPAGALLLGIMLLTIPFRFILERFCKKTKLISLIELGLLLFWGLGFLITPFSDHNGPVIHNQLFSGNTIRMALPVILLGLMLFSKVVAHFLDEQPARLKMWAYAIFVISLINVLWYDLACLLTKPENAFAALAPVACSFNNLKLGLLFLLIAGACAAACWRRILLIPLLCAGLLVFHLNYPDSLTHTMRFKQIGKPSAAFDFLRRNASCKNITVAVHSADESSAFLACMNDVLLRYAGRTVYAERLDNIRNAGLLIVCAKDTDNISDPVRGRNYQASFDFFDESQINSSLREIYRDDFYRIYTTNPQP